MCGGSPRAALALLQLETVKTSYLLHWFHLGTAAGPLFLLSLTPVSHVPCSLESRHWKGRTNPMLLTPAPHTVTCSWSSIRESLGLPLCSDQWWHVAPPFCFCSIPGLQVFPCRCRGSSCGERLLRVLGSAGYSNSRRPFFLCLLSAQPPVSLLPEGGRAH